MPVAAEGLDARQERLRLPLDAVNLLEIGGRVSLGLRRGRRARRPV